MPYERVSGEGKGADGRQLDGRCLREWLGIFHKLLAKYDLAALVPAVGLLPEDIPGYGYAALTDGSGSYVLYFVDEKVYRLEPCDPRTLTVSLALPPGEYAAQTFDPKTGATEDLPSIRSDGTAQLGMPRFTEDMAALLRGI